MLLVFHVSVEGQRKLSIFLHENKLQRTPERLCGICFAGARIKHVSLQNVTLHKLNSKSRQEKLKMQAYNQYH